MSQRKLIRKKIQALLIAGAVVDDEKVFANRAFTYNADKLPAINIQTLTESAALWSVTTPTYKRTLKVAIICATKALKDIDDTLDDLIESIEAIIFADDTLGGLVENLRYSDTELNIQVGDGQVAAIAIKFDMDYYTDHPTAVENLDDFEKMHHEFKKGPDADVVLEGNDTIPI